MLATSWTGKRKRTRHRKCSALYVTKAVLIIGLCVDDTQMQYSHHQTQATECRCSYFNNIPAKKITYKCSGVKVCEHLDPRLQVFTEPSDEYWELADHIRNEDRVISVERDASSLYEASVKAFASRTACRDRDTGCRLTSFVSHRSVC